MKRIIYLGMALLTFICMMGCSDYEYVADGDICAVLGYKGNAKEITIPESIKGKQVLFIGAGPLSNHIYPRKLKNYKYEYNLDGRWGDVEKIIIPDTVVCLGDDAFAKSRYLTEIVIPNSVTSLHHRVFGSCPQLRAVKLPDGIEYFPSGTFEGCVNLVSVELPENLISIGQAAFYECSSLEWIEFPDGLQEISLEAFWGCSSLREVILADSVEYVGRHAFEYCEDLTNVVLSSGLAWLKDSTFSMCGKLEHVEINSNVKIGEYAFLNCTNLSSIKMNAGPVKIDDSAFGGCKGSSVLELPEGLESIGDLVFGGWPDLATVYMPSTVKEVGRFPFYGCTNLQSITVGPANPTYSSRDGWLYDKSGTQLMLCPEKIEASVIVPSGVINIADDAFGSASINRIHIPHSVTQVGDAFDFCPYLMEITVDGDNEKYCAVDGMLMDKGQTKLIRCPPGKVGKINVLEGVTSIEPNAFQYCRGITEVKLPDSVSLIGESAFEGCVKLTKISIPKNVSSIVKSTFEGCRSLPRIVIPQHVAQIGKYAFDDCESLEQIVVDEANPVYSSHDGMLYDKQKETLILCPEGKAGTATVPHGVLSMEFGAFAGCHELITVELPKTISRIEDYAFIRCSNLSHIVIPASVESIGDSAFGQCPKLTYVYFEGDIPTFEGWTIFRCYGEDEEKAVLYYRPGKKGWQDEVAGRPTKVWKSEQ